MSWNPIKWAAKIGLLQKTGRRKRALRVYPRTTQPAARFSLSLSFGLSFIFSHDLFKQKVWNDECRPPRFYSHFKVDNLRPTAQRFSCSENISGTISTVALLGRLYTKPGLIRARSAAGEWRQPVRAEIVVRRSGAERRVFFFCVFYFFEYSWTARRGVADFRLIFI